MTPEEYREKYRHDVSNTRQPSLEQYQEALEKNDKGIRMDMYGKESDYYQKIIDIYETRQQIMSRGR